MKANPNNLKRFVVVPTLFISLASLVFLHCNNPLAKTAADLEAGFVTPPESAKPRVWWHWMSGNVSKAGINADLTWMKRIGIGGFQNFDAGLSTPQIVDKRLVYMTPEWKDAFLFTTKLADSLGLEMAIAGSPGWSESGGPWVTPERAMKKYVWSETRIKGGQPFNGILPKPLTTTGEFQNIPIKHSNKHEFYSDASVVAYRIAGNDISIAGLKPKVTSSGGNFDLALLTDGDLEKSITLPNAKPGEKSWIQFEFAKPEEIQSFSIAMTAGRRKFYLEEEGKQALEVSDDGINFKTVLEFRNSESPQNTITFLPIKAKYFRFVFATTISQRYHGVLLPKQRKIAELVLYKVARVNRFEEKAGFSPHPDLYSLATPSVSASDVINKNEVIDLTSKMQPDGTLNWTPPSGEWMVLRLGYSLTGKENHPASPEATGLEVDKLSAEHCKAYFTEYLRQYKDATGGLMGKRGLQYMITDSWEAGTMNWTDKMMADFKNLRGYDMLPWLPVLTGHIVESAEASDKFLWDFRKTIADLTAKNHYDLLTTILHDQGMGRYTESHERGRAFVADGMEVKRTADVPMSATWTPEIVGSNTIQPYSIADVRESASVAHIYGQNLVAAESMTAKGTAWAWSPQTLKSTADMELASGLNRFVIHCSVHQPVFDKLPGLGLGPYGQWFTRNETWAEQAAPWITYLARSSYMLQQGKFIADIAYFYGEDNNITALFRDSLPKVPSGYNYDFVNADIVSNILTVDKEGQLITPSGMSYRLLALDNNNKYMTLKVLRKINEFVQAGACVVGTKPLMSPSLADDQAEFKTIADQLWGAGTGVMNHGKGKVYAGMTVSEALESMKIMPDFEYAMGKDSADLLFVHRKLDDIDIYWVNNRKTKVENVDAIFRVDGKAPEIWHPETGLIEDASYSINKDRVTVPLKMEPNDAQFIVFQKKAKSSSLTLKQPVEKQLAVIDGAWDVTLQSKFGTTKQIVLNELTSWSENADLDVKYFSGTGSYTKTFQANADWFKEGSQIWLDLGSVKNLAEVVVNGKSLGIIWKTPFRINVTKALKEGENNLEIKVTNLWVNRLIGDMQPGVTNKMTYTTMDFYKADSPLQPSGLLGPVRMVSFNAQK